MPSIGAPEILVLLLLAGLVVLPLFALTRRGRRKRELEERRHQELLEATKRGP